MTSWNRTMPLPRPPAAETPVTHTTSPLAAPVHEPVPPSAQPVSEVQASQQVGSIALSSGAFPLDDEFDDAPFQAPPSWGNKTVAPAYPPLPRAYFPTKTSLQAPELAVPPTEPPAMIFDTFEMKGPPSGMPQPSERAVSMPVSMPVSLPRRTVVLLGQTASVEAPEATPQADMLPYTEEHSGVRPLPPDAPPWHVSARHLSGLLESAIFQQKATPFFMAAVERALAAFRLSGHPPAQIARVYHLVVRAHEAMRSTNRADLRDVIADCALVIRRSLPSEVRSRLSDEQVSQIVEQLQQENDPRRARGLAVAQLLGWPSLPEEWLLDAVDAALASSPK